MNERKVTFHSAATASATGTVMNLTCLSSLAVQLTGTWVGTVTFQATIDASNWVAIEAYNPATNERSSTATANGLYVLPVAGYRLFRCNLDWTSGTSITVTGIGTDAQNFPYYPLVYPLQSEQVLAAATGSDDGLGKVATVTNGTWLYVRVDTDDHPRGQVDWRLKCNQQYDYQLYKSRAIQDEVTLTLSSFTDENTVVINGLTYTGEATADDAAFASRKFSTAGGTDALDAAELAKVINADYAVTTAGTSVAATDKLVITTDEGAHTIVAAAAADYPAGKYKLDATAATEMASIVLAINHSQNVTCASSTTNDTVTVNGVVFTSKAAEDTTAHEFDNDSSDNATATSLAACINDATDGVDGVTAVASANVVYLYRDTQDDTITLTSSNGTRHPCVTTVGGVPGVLAVATGATAELSITPTWTKTLTVTEAGNKLTVVDIDLPGIVAAADSGVVTLTPGTPAGTDGDLAHLIQATAAANCTVAQTATLAGIYEEGTITVDVAATTSGGRLYTQNIDDYEYCYFGVKNDSGGAAATVVVGATIREG